jgi:hypothetical protein
MTGAGPLAQAAAELYAADLGEFTARRAELASRARAGGDQETARQIAGLRKPTRAAWLVNQLVRADPGVPGRLAELGTDLRAAAAALDGARIRELSQARRRLVDDLVRAALQRPGQQAPGAGVREELTVTFGAAVADPEVARQLAAGNLVRAVQHGGLGGLELELGPPARAGDEPAAGPGAGRPRPRKRTAAEGARREPARGARPEPAASGPPRRREQAGEQRARREQEQAERDRQRQLAAAQRVLAAAERAAGAAARAERQRDEEVQRLEAQLAGLQARLAEAREQLAGARQRSGDAQRAGQAARDAAQRLGG